MSTSTLTAVRGRNATASANRWIALAVLSLAQLMIVLDGTIVNIALPVAQRGLGFSTDDRQWVVTGYALALGSLLLLGGRLSDLFGHKRMFLIGVGGFAVASAGGGAATGFGMLLAARIAQGAFAAMLAPAALSLVSVTFADDPNERGRAFGIFGAVAGAGGAIGLLLGGVLTQSVSWRWCLYVNLIIAMVAFTGALAWLRDGSRRTRLPLDIAGAVTVALGLVGIVYALGNSQAKGWTSVGTLGALIAGVILLVTFVLIERRVSYPLLPLRIILDRGRGTAYLSIGISGIGSFAVFLFLTYYLENTLKFTPVQTGLAFLPFVALLVAGAIVSGGVLPRTGPRLPVATGSLLAAIGMALLTGITTGSSYAGGVLPGLLVMGLGSGLIFGSAQNAATSGVNSNQAGVASAMVNTTQQIGGSIGTATFSSLAATAMAASGTIAGYHLVFWIAAAIFLGGAVLAAIGFRSGPLPADPDAVPATMH